MHDNGTIDATALQQALAQPLRLAPPPADHRPCAD
jgi:hypothetical protein